MPSWNRSALLLAALSFAPNFISAQSADTTRRFSVFGGIEPLQYSGTGRQLSDLGFGGSFDFRTSAFPLKLRTTVAFSQESATWLHSSLHYGNISLDAVSDLGKHFGIRPYLLGGVGIGTLASASYFMPQYIVENNQVVISPDSRYFNAPRQNWAYLEGGGGLEFGKFFVEGKIQQPAATNGPTRKPLSFGIRF